MGMTPNAPTPKASVIIPASNEAGYIAACLKAVLASDGDVVFETVVVANGCQDDTAGCADDVARMAPPHRPIRIIDTAQGGKLNALNLGDAAAQAPIRIYLDADVTVSAGLIPALIAALDAPAARYASGLPRVAPAKSAVTQAYARFWQKLPFVTDGVPGFGLFAMNAKGRARWGDWPDIISDDTFARLNFTPAERVSVQHSYLWPMIEGFSGLVRVRRRQDLGVQEIAQRFAPLTANVDPAPHARRQKLRAALRDPLGFGIYAAVALAVRLRRGASAGWERGR